MICLAVLQIRLVREIIFASLVDKTYNFAHYTRNVYVLKMNDSKTSHQEDFVYPLDCRTYNTYALITHSIFFFLIIHLHNAEVQSTQSIRKAHTFSQKSVSKTTAQEIIFK